MGKRRGGFLDCLNDGRQGEEYILGLLKENNLPAQSNTARDKRLLSGWDIRTEVAGVSLTLEVKHDMLEASTGNIAIEFYNTTSGKPSGIAATTADLWVVVLEKPRRAYVCHVGRLREYVRSGRDNPRILSSVGDGNAAIALYSSGKILSQHFLCLDEDVGQTLLQARQMMVKE